MNFKTTLITLILGILITFGAMACQKGTQQNTVSSGPQKMVSTNNQSQLLFFLNPYGRPCQQQERILENIEDQVSKKVTIQRIDSNNPSNNGYYYQYGVRALPMMMLVDKEGNVLESFSPGIQSADFLLEKINNCNC